MSSLSPESLHWELNKSGRKSARHSPQSEPFPPLQTDPDMSIARHKSKSFPSEHLAVGLGVGPGDGVDVGLEDGLEDGESDGTEVGVAVSFAFDGLKVSLAEGYSDTSPA
mmetsp:Transcript_6322/g.14587  ORF Transcript_6322/g.14587 Transcript_6322/m.14587 type:complete len:110 (+) Transcript_6322:627-956(+)